MYVPVAVMASVYNYVARHLRDWTVLLVSTASQHVAAAHTLAKGKMQPLSHPILLFLH